ncbi:hypothetical protein Goshw_001598, partial [Gossypium schwendimanii]|nr:hypothetical protein [Gossypium schwendimanii]
TELKEFYKKLWSLQLPSKIAFTIWQISCDFIPNFANLRYRRVISNDRCPQCCLAIEESAHVFRECPMTTEVWQQLNLSWVMNNMSQNIWEWLTWVFKRSNNGQCLLFCYAHDSLEINWYTRGKTQQKGI